MAKGRKQPAHRGYDPGGFRFPTRAHTAFGQGDDYIRSAEGIAPIVSGSTLADAHVMALAVVNRFAARRRGGARG